MKINVSCSLANIRRFIIDSTCKDIMPELYYRDKSVFPERSVESGIMYIETKDKETLGITEEIRFVRATDVNELIYNSKSGRTKLKWTRTEGENGRLLGEASLNTLTNLAAAKILSP